tara:strand:- start:234 stop:1025 length:792 start_codon:yes stop_codon:yes gene_type:complete
MSDNESEQSLDEELQHNNDEEEVYETVIKKGLDRKTTNTVKVKKERTPAQKAATEKMLQARMAKKKLKETPEPVIEETVENEIIEEAPKKNISQARIKAINKNNETKKISGAIVKSNVKKIKKQIMKEMPMKEIYKERVIYMIPTQNGFIESDSIPRLSKKEIQKMDNEELVSKKELEIGKKIIRKKNGTADNRSKPRTEKQIAANKKLGELSKQRQLKKKEDKKSELNKEIKSALIDVVSRPIETTKKEIEKPKYDFSIIKI